MDKRRKQLKPPRKGKSKKEQKTGKWRDKGEKGCLGPKLWKNALSRNVKESLKKFLDQGPEADDFQNLISSFLITDTSVVKFS